MRIGWEPSVGTRHLIVSVGLVWLIILLLTLFTYARLINLKLDSKREAEKRVADYLFQAAQQAILTHPQQAPEQSIKEDAAVRWLLETSVGTDKDFAYLAIISTEGMTIAEADPQQIRQARQLIAPIEELEEARLPRQILALGRRNRIYEVTIPLSLSGKPFGQIVAGIPMASLREELSSPLWLSTIVALAVAAVALLVAVLLSGLVVQPLRKYVPDTLQHIEQLERDIEQLKADSSVPAEELVGRGRGDLYSITQRLRVLSRRFASNRNEIEAMRDQLHQMVTTLAERVVLLDREGKVIMASPEAERILSEGRPLRGRRLTEALGLSHPLSGLAVRAFSECRSLQEPALIPIDGVGAQTFVVSVQIFQDHGQPAGALLALRDFESLRRLESQLDYATKLADLSNITKGVAHEMKNPLHAMVLHLELLNAKLEAGADPKPHLEVLTSQINRLNRVVQTFLDFNRPVELNLQLLDANLLAHEIALLTADARSRGIELREQYAPSPLLIKADKDLLTQAILNIVINGCQAMPDGGLLILETGRTAEGQVQVAVTDHGPGIPAEVREKIFNLYFTTKPNGNGIGLAQAFRAVQLHDGRIEFDTEVGVGTCFRIILPAA